MKRYLLNMGDDDFSNMKIYCNVKNITIKSFIINAIKNELNKVKDDITQIKKVFDRK